MASEPVHFTREFRLKMAQLSLGERRDWLASLAARAPGAEADSVVAQELREVARGCRLALVQSIASELGPFEPRHLQAILEVPRERFVRPGDVARSADDTPLPLDAEGNATISAPHAYLLSFRLLDLRPGDTLVEYGTGSGYGAALAAYVVGPGGRVVTVEIDEALAAWAGRTLAGEPNVNVVSGDATAESRPWVGAPKVSVTFAVDALPAAWLEALPEGGKLVAPVGGGDQRLVLVTKRRGSIIQTRHGAVRYVKNRSTR